MVLAVEIKEAAHLLRQGKLVAFPTETVYGLGADASSAQALAELYRVKGRPVTHPVIVHLADFTQVAYWAHVPESAKLLAEKFWPGPMTLILPRASHVLDQVTGGQDSVGIRIPSHPLALELLREFGGGVAAPSANRFGRLSPTSAQAVAEGLGDDVSMILDGGSCQVGIESTIISLLDQPAILRPGMIAREQVEAVIGRLADPVAAASGAPAAHEPRVPGALASHYAPLTELIIMRAEQILAHNFGPCGIIAFPQTCRSLRARKQDVVVEASLDPEEYARMIYGELRRLDALKLERIIVEAVPAEGKWHGVYDRLSRASVKA